MRLTEKLRPATLGEIACQSAAVAEIEGQIAAGIGGRSLLLTGLPGLGKTSAARAIAKRLDILPIWNLKEVESGECNAEEVLSLWDFVKHLPVSRENGKPDEMRMVIVDEAQNVTRDAEKKLRWVVENLPDHAVLVFTSNPPDNPKRSDWFAPTAALGSRVTRIEFTPPDNRELMLYLIRVAHAETGDGAALPYAEIVRRSGGNIRAAVGLLEVEIRKLRPARCVAGVKQFEEAVA